MRGPAFMAWRQQSPHEAGFEGQNDVSVLPDATYTRGRGPLREHCAGLPWLRGRDSNPRPPEYGLRRAHHCSTSRLLVPDRQGARLVRRGKK